jgi:FkbM family methyltransferase
MILDYIYRSFLRRPFFHGQDRLFNALFSRNLLQKKSIVAKPIKGNFKINCNTATWIGAKIYYLGDYEPFLKDVFKAHIGAGDKVLDVGANIGFHSLYFAELVGETGSVLAFEPVPQNFEALKANIGLNDFKQIKPINLALGNKNEQLTIAADADSKNPGAYNLFNLDGNIKIDCVIGDEFLHDQKVDFIKIDVEGYESFVIDGLLKMIEINRPKIVFEFDPNYHQKTGLPTTYIFTTLANFNYHFLKVTNDGTKQILDYNTLSSGNILAIPNE